MRQNKLLLLLVLLAAVATGAWADSFSADAYAANATLNGVSVSTDQTVTINEGVTVTVNNGLSIQSNATLTVTGGGTLVVNGANGADGQNEGIGVDPEMGEEVWLNATPGGNGNSGIVIDNGGKLIISNATIIAVGGKGGQGGKFEDESYAANGNDGNGFSSFPAIDGAVMSYSTNGTDYTEYASGDKTLYRYMKAVPAPTGYSITLDEGTGKKDSQNWEITPKSSELSGGEDVTVKYNGSREVKSVTVVKKGAVDNTYLAWDGTQKKLVATEIPAEATTVANADAGVTWSAGTYVVEGQVNINGSITLNGNVDLIIKDGATLTAKHINGFNGNSSSYNLSIYGQANQTGELVINRTDGNAIMDINTLEVHSAKVTATSSADLRGGFSYISTFNVYGGLVDAKNTGSNGYGILLKEVGSMNIYEGEVNAEGKGSNYGITCEESINPRNVTVYGGKLWAGCANNKALNIHGNYSIVLTKDNGYTSGKIEYSSDNKNWSEEVDANAKYVRVGY